MSDVEDQLDQAIEAVEDINLDDEGDLPSPTAMSLAGSVGSSVSQSKQNKVEIDAAMFHNAMQLVINLQNKVIALEAKNETVPAAAPSADVVPYTPTVFRNTNLKDWSNKIEESRKFKIGSNNNAFSSAASRFEYIRILINGFITLPEFAAMTFEELFNPENGYGNFQSLLNMVPVPCNHAGFYLNEAKKAHLQSKFLSSPVAATHATASPVAATHATASGGGLFTFGAQPSA